MSFVVIFVFALLNCVMAKERLGSPIFNCTSAVLYSLLESHFRRGFGYLKAVSKCPNIEPCKRPFKFPFKCLERGIEFKDLNETLNRLNRPSESAVFSVRIGLPILYRYR